MVHLASDENKQWLYRPTACKFAQQNDRSFVLLGRLTAVEFMAPIPGTVWGENSVY